ncbi:hypothetical protein GJ700_08385 [Duganella sp. FT92W]|uniref:Copper resistance protein n=1 Tax=Pseudoduganella rivuli TaxID=2666085 RepID=A0A7X2LTD5_9BURK|nr:hypothetical protein [Pseudoduganella rivuli]MRV71744.1 hypothetical protein [Pseudoduganella rivuli]
MKPSRVTRLVATVIAVISLLFAQLAVAAYACPGMVTPERLAISAMEGMEHCTAMDNAQPNLCHAHNHASQQSLDRPDVPPVPPFLASGLVQMVVMPELIVPPSQAAPAIPSMARATSPPLAIRLCCFRI